MKYIIVILLGITLVGGVAVYAKTTGLEYTQKISIENTNSVFSSNISVYKVYDHDNGVSCYVSYGYQGTGTGTGISCVK